MIGLPLFCFSTRVSTLIITSWSKIVAGAPAVVPTFPPSGRNEGRREARGTHHFLLNAFSEILSPTINWTRTQVHSST